VSCDASVLSDEHTEGNSLFFQNYTRNELDNDFFIGQAVGTFVCRASDYFHYCERMYGNRWRYHREATAFHPTLGWIDVIVDQTDIFGHINCKDRNANIRCDKQLRYFAIDNVEDGDECWSQYNYHKKNSQ
jgi:hypothetical protein